MHRALSEHYFIWIEHLILRPLSSFKVQKSKQHITPISNT
jgi:hypothetical protein